MTLIIGALTKEYVLLATDRMITFQNESGDISFRDESTCKLVKFCNEAGIAYCGLAELDGLPTDEWIAITLAKNSARNIPEAVNILKTEASRIFQSGKSKPHAVEFVLAGWAAFNEETFLRPHFAKITNLVDNKGVRSKEPLRDFQVILSILPHEHSLLLTSAGEDLNDNQRYRLGISIEQLLKEGQGPTEVLMEVIGQIISVSLYQTEKTVGTNVLSMCIPKASTNDPMSIVTASKPNLDSPTFHYYEKGYSELVQYGPTVVCGKRAFTDVITKSDPSKNFQSSQIRILH